LDVETNGGIAGRHRVIEIGAVRIRNGQEGGTFHTLVNPGHRVPERIRKLTGISDEMLLDAPTASEVLDGLYEFVADRPLVGHNIMADMAFLRHEALWALRRPLANPTIDTLALSTRLLPHLKKPSLSRLAAQLGLSELPRHRALIDARVTAHVFHTLLDMLSQEHITTLDDLLHWLSAGANIPDTVSRVLLRWQIGILPSLPGVYLFRDKAGEVLYVGKSKSLRRRVLSHFSSPERQLDGLAQRVASVDFEVTGSEFEALLREAQLIQDLQPAYNIQRRYRQTQPYVRLWRTAGGLHVRAASKLKSDGASYFGPYQNRSASRWAARTGRRILEVTAQLPENERTLLVLRFFQEGPEALLTSLEQQADAEFQPLIRLLRRLRRAHLPLSGGIAGHAAVLVYPTNPPGNARIFAVRSGCLLFRQDLAPATAVVLQQQLNELFTSLLTSPPPAEAERTVQHFILSWIYQHRHDPAVVPLDPISLETAAQATMERLARMGVVLDHAP
jgi:DNA polymerase III epsilon subunit family exonuclease